MSELERKKPRTFTKTEWKDETLRKQLEMFLRSLLVNQGTICSCCGAEVEGKLTEITLVEPTLIECEAKPADNYYFVELEDAELGQLQFEFCGSDPERKSRFAIPVEFPSCLFNIIVYRLELGDLETCGYTDSKPKGLGIDWEALEEAQ